MQIKVITRFFLTLFVLALGFSLSAQPLTDDEQIADLRLRAIEFDQKTAEWYETVKTRRINSEEQLADLDEKIATKTQIRNLEKQIQRLRKQENAAFSIRKDASDHLIEVNTAQKLAQKKKTKRIIELEKAYWLIKAKLVEQQNSELPDYKTIAAVVPEPKEQSQSKEVLNEPKAENVAFPTDAPSETKAEKNDNEPTSKEIKKAKAKKAVKPQKVKKQTETLPDVDQTNIVTITTNNEKEKTIKAKPNIVPIKYNPADDVMRNPPIPKCQIDFDGKDEFSGKTKRVLAPQLWFTSTDDVMRPIMGERDYIHCDAQITQIEGGFVFLNLTFTIQTKEAQKAFGFLDRGGVLGIRLMNGRNITLACNKTDIGTVDEKRGVTTFKTQYSLQAKDINALQTSEVDVVRVSWSAGFEDYDVTNLDLFMNLFRCLK